MLCKVKNVSFSAWRVCSLGLSLSLYLGLCSCSSLSVSVFACMSSISGRIILTLAVSAMSLCALSSSSTIVMTAWLQYAPLAGSFWDKDPNAGIATALEIPLCWINLRFSLHCYRPSLSALSAPRIHQRTWARENLMCILLPSALTLAWTVAPHLGLAPLCQMLVPECGMEMLVWAKFSEHPVEQTVVSLSKFGAQIQGTGAGFRATRQVLHWIHNLLWRPPAQVFVWCSKAPKIVRHSRVICSGGPKGEQLRGGHLKMGFLSESRTRHVNPHCSF